MKKSEVTVELVTKDDPAESLSEADRRHMPVRARYVYRFSGKGYQEERTVVRDKDGRWRHTPWSSVQSYATHHEAVDAALDSFTRSIKTFRKSQKRQ